MRWSKVRKLVHESFADSVRRRVRIDVTNAHPRGVEWRDNCKIGRMTVDGRVVARLDPHSQPQLTLRIGDNSGEEGVRTQAGTFMDPAMACWEYLHSSVNDSLRSQEPFVSSLAMLSAKVGRTRLQRALAWELHPLTLAMLKFRLEAERQARELSSAKHALARR
jgi:hypothetical protein